MKTSLQQYLNKRMIKEGLNNTLIIGPIQFSNTKQIDDYIDFLISTQLITNN